MQLSVIILAAGQGTRMRSELPKVLHTLAGRPLLEHVYQAASALAAARVYIVYGHGGERVKEALCDLNAEWIEQARQLGTGHAVAQALPAIDPQHRVLIVYGDVPLITGATLERLVAAADNGLALLTVERPDPSGYGRIVRSPSGAVQRIVEEQDASAEQLAIREINTGTLAVSARRLKDWVARLDNRNAQGEYYLTDVIAMAVAEPVPIATVSPDSVFEVTGVNDRVHLAELERYYQRCQAEHLMRAGVTLLDPQRFDLRGDLEIGQDVVIDANVILEGRIRIGHGVQIGPNTTIKDCEIADRVVILANSVLDGARIGSGARIGPFSRIRPETQLAEAVHIGNFVEVKQSAVASGSKINHLSYVGDAEIGRNVNIGAGTITCNYDGANKHKTIIGNDVFIGSDTQLVAPVRIADGATIGAGTTVTDDAPAGTLTVGRARQTSVPGWQRPRKDP